MAMENNLLENKVILITGSSRGIGATTARLAKKYGAEVIVHGKTESEQLRALASELKAKYIYCDITNEEDVRIKVSKLGSIDILVNNAGINPSKTFQELKNDDWREIFETNVLGTVNFSRTVLPRMIERREGKIINIASIKGYNHINGKPAYAASKAAIMRITSSMAEEFADTEMTRTTLSPKIQEQIKNIPLKRLAQAEEIAEVILFLASNKASYITGQTILVDGGYSIK